MEKKVNIKEDFIKLDSLLKFSGIAGTGGHAKILILNGEIKVNNEICTMRGKKVHKGDFIEFKDIKIIVE